MSRTMANRARSKVWGSDRARGTRWVALFVALAAITVPDCYLEGRHLFGAGMDAFAFICRSPR
jgi:hypothetical protein